MPLRLVSCGRPLSGHEVRVTDAEGKALPETTEGNLEFRGPSTMLGYYRNPEATGAAGRADGWMASGDRGYLAEGEVFVTGRNKDMIIRAGRNLYPQEIEELVSDVHGVRRGCVAAFGVSDPDLGTEKLVVVAETRQEAEEERQRIAHQIQTRLAEVFEAPADEVLLVSPRTVPKTSGGKLRRSDCPGPYSTGELRGAGGDGLAGPGPHHPAPGTCAGRAARSQRERGERGAAPPGVGAAAVALLLSGGYVCSNRRTVAFPARGVQARPGDGPAGRAGGARWPAA